LKKEEILNRSRNENKDERLLTIETEALSVGLVTVLAFVVIFGLWNLAHGIRSFELSAIFTGYLATAGFYKYKKLQTKRELVVGIFGTVATAATSIAFFLGV
jgi:hypothetical protein